MSKEDKPIKSEPGERTRQFSKNMILSWAVFLPTIIIVLLSILSVLFPALLTRSTSPFQGVVATPEFVNAFEPGILAIPLVIINLIVLGIGFAHYRKIKITGLINKISGFELSKRQALIGIIILLAIFVAITAGTLAKEETWVDYKGVKETVQAWHPSRLGLSAEPHVRYFLLQTSLVVLGNIRIVPFLASAALLVLTYFFTKDITQKRFSGIVSMALLLQSQIFISYSTSASYDNLWILFYLFSLYLVQKFWPPSPVSFIVSIFSKALTVAFLPMTLYFIARSTISKKSKIISLVSYGAVILAIIAGVSVFKSSTGDLASFDPSQFWQGFSAMAMQMRFDYIIPIFLLPLVVMLFFASRKGVLHADSIMVCIISILLTAPFLLALTTQTNQPYRFVPLSVFFAIGVGVLLSKRTRKRGELLSSTQ